MNLLQSLALRTLDSAASIAPPRVPFVNVFPEELTEAAEPRPEGPWPAEPRPHVAAPARDAQSPPAPHDSRPSKVHIASLPSPAALDAPETRAHGISADVERSGEPPTARIVERFVEIEPAPASNVPIATNEKGAAPGSSPATPAIGREVIETHHHHWIEPAGATELRVIEEVQRPADGPEPAAIAPEAVQPVRIAPAALPSRTPVVPARVAASRDEHRATPEPPPVPAVHVAIGRVTVRLQTPAAATKSETTRPVAPDVDLRAYTTAQRNRKR